VLAVKTYVAYGTLVVGGFFTHYYQKLLLSLRGNKIFESNPQ